MIAVRRTAHGRTWYAAGVAAALALVISASSSAVAATNLVVTIAGNRVAQRKGVTVTVTGGDLGAPLAGTTNYLGKVKFPALAAGTYIVVPSKDGWRYIPESRLVVLDGLATARKVRFAPRRLPALASLTAAPAELVLMETRLGTVTVSILDANGNGVEGAPVAATSSAELVARVEPAVLRTDARGRAAFTVTAAGSVEYFMAQPLREVLGSATLTFSSGGWRGTPVRTATTAMTLERGDETALWLSSGHGDATSEAFRNWDEDGEISTSCAKCHSRPGFLDFIADGTVDEPAPTGTVIDCFLCHDPNAWALDSVTFPSGASATGLGHEAICMTCHQGRQSKISVDSYLAGYGDDEILPSGKSFRNIHYFFAAATQFGTQAKGGYEYDGLDYDGKAPHVLAADTCIECHNQHSLAVRMDRCRECHPEVTDYASIRNLRMAASTRDYDGNGVVTEGIAAELYGLAERLYDEIRAYAVANGGGIVYDTHSHPYFFRDGDGDGVADAEPFTDTNANGVWDDGEPFTDVNGNAEYDDALDYTGQWTPRLMKAAYNYHSYHKDPGAHAHNPKYFIELLYDSIADLGGDATGLARNDAAHFNTTSEAFRDWDDTGTVSSSCARCHSGRAGFRYYLENGYGSVTSQPSAYRMSCETCHTGVDFAGEAPRVFVQKVVFPGGATVLNDPVNPDSSFVCMTCHQGRQSKGTVDTYVTGYGADEIMPSSKSFRNLHYAAAGATIYGHQALVGYEYAGKVYANKFGHWGINTAQCAYCHDIAADRHTFLPRLTPACSTCHTELVGGDIETLRLNRPYDYNGNGNIVERLPEEMAVLAEALYDEIKAYASAHGGGIVYEGHDNPYFFQDLDENGVPDLDGGGEPVSYAGLWTPRLMKAAFNYQYYQKETGAWAHNTNYLAQLLIDAIEDLGGEVGAYQRPVGF